MTEQLKMLLERRKEVMAMESKEQIVRRAKFAVRAAQLALGRSRKALDHAEQALDEAERDLLAHGEEPQVYKNFLGEVQSGNAVKEKILRIRHPEKGIRFISTSMTLLYDDHRISHIIG